MGNPRVKGSTSEIKVRGRQTRLAGVDILQTIQCNKDYTCCDSMKAPLFDAHVFLNSSQLICSTKKQPAAV